MLAEWPLAYHNVRLADHLNCVAKLAIHLFERELRVLERRVGKGNLRDILYLAAVTHDIGKASRYYIEEFSRGGRLTFPYHEVVGALIIKATSWKLLKVNREEVEDLARVLDITAKIVSRHHAAMTGRHPRDLTYPPLRESTIGRVRGMLKSIRVDEMRALIEELINGAPGGLPMAVRALEELRDRLEDVMREIMGSEGVIWSDLSELAKLNLDRKEHVIIPSLTGMLMVADNLVANVERRESSDGMTPLYTMFWERELSKRLMALSITGYSCSWG